MKTRKNIARLLSFLMVLSLLLGISAAPVYAVGGEGETASFEIKEANGQTGTVQYKLDSGVFTVADSTPVNLNGVSSITIKATPVADAQVNQSNSGITGTEQAVSFDYAALTSESGWTYQIQDNDGSITFAIEFDNHDGTGGGSNPGGGGGEGGEGTYTVYFGEGSWEIGGVTVTADKTDVQYLAYNDIITLENFDPETMEVRVEAEDGFRTTLAVTDGQTSISAHTNDGGVPADIAFSVVLKSSGDNGGGDGGDAPVIWDGPQVEHQSDHGSISVKSIEIGSKTYTYQGEGKFAHNGDEIEQLEWYGYNKTSIAEEGGIRVYGDVFTEENVDVFYINFEFKPDYGYQATHVRMTEDDPIPLSDAGFSAAEAIRTFRFAVYPDAHTHFSVIFTATEDIVKANAASISEGGVELAAGELDGGSAVLEVNEANVTNQGDFEEAAEGYVVSEYLDISLYNVFYKGNAEDVWSTPVENLDSPAEITLKLEEGIDTDTVKIVHEKGEGDFELLDADYDPETQEIIFQTSSFSNYAIAYTVDNEEFETESYTLTDDKGNVISLTYEKNRELSFTMIDYLAFSPEDLETAGIPQELYDSWMEGIANATKQHGTLLSFYEIQVENDDGFLIHEGPFYIKIKMTDEMKKYDIFKIVYIDVEDNLATESPITLTQEGGYLVGTLEHLSTYALVGDNEEFETESFTLTDDKGNVISLTYEKNRELSFTMIDYLAFSPEELEAMGIPQELYDSMMEGILNATKQHGTLLSFYEILVENDDGFSIHEGPFNIKIKMTDEMKKYDIFKIVYMDVEDNFATESPITLTRDGEYLVGTLEHLSTYALVGDNAPGENDAPADSDTSAPTSPQTGDNSNLGLWVFLLVLSSCSMIALIVIDKKRKIAK